MKNIIRKTTLKRNWKRRLYEEKEKLRCADFLKKRQGLLAGNLALIMDRTLCYIYCYLRSGQSAAFFS